MAVIWGIYKKITVELLSQAVIPFLNYYYLCYDLNCHISLALQR